MNRAGLNLLSVLLVAVVIGGCAGFVKEDERVKSSLGNIVAIQQSYLARDTDEESEQAAVGATDETVSVANVSEPKKLISLVDSLGWTYSKADSDLGPEGSLADVDELRVAAEKMPIRDFVHYVFGELLGVNYVLDPSIDDSADEALGLVTLSIENAINSRQLFRLSSRVLEGLGVALTYSNDTFFFSRNVGDNRSSQTVIGIGRDRGSVPKTSGKIMQVIPIKFGIKVTMERTLVDLGGAKITPDFGQSAIFAEGSREEILKVIELIDLLDTPASKGRYIGLIPLTYISALDFANEVEVLLDNEGIRASIGKPGNNNVALVPLKKMGAVAVFATEPFFIERIKYWSTVVDVPLEGEGNRFYIYHPKYSRAEDLETSISSLLGITDSSPEGVAGGRSGNAPLASRSSGSGLGGIRLAMDEKANALIFYTTGEQYRNMLPLLAQLDVMPKQVMLDILIAEVSLKDEFKHGVEWAIARGEVNLTTQGAFGATTIGGVGLVINGKEGPLQANSLITNSLVNVLSNPTLMVRSGTQANINVGSSISIVGSTTQDPINGDRETSMVEYKDTGVTISVDVNVNAVGIVAMKISQNISNSVPGGAGAGGNPDIFERSLDTEVLAESGQTVLLGGLISQTYNNGGSGVPVLSKIPVFGNLFKANAKASDRTELVMLVTPRVIDNLAEWDDVLLDFTAGLKYLQSGERKNALQE